MDSTETHCAANAHLPVSHSLAALTDMGEFADHPADPAELRCFLVRFVRQGVVEAQFEVMAEDSVQATIQHMGAANGAAVKVTAMEVWRAQCERREAELARATS